MTVFDEGGELVGMYNSTMEAHFLPPVQDRLGSLMTTSRASSNSNIHYLDFNDSPLDQPGPNKPEWQAYLGEYDVIWEDEPDSTATITVKNGYLYFRDGKCEEHEPGLFFVYDGEALDLRLIPYTYATQKIRKRAQ